MFIACCLPVTNSISLIPIAHLWYPFCQKRLFILKKGHFMMRITGSFSVDSGYRHPVFPVLFILFMFASGMMSGCGTLSNGRTWGQDATWKPGWDRIGDAAVDAVLSPETWGPLAAALVLQIDDMDGRISDWASDRTPLFGSLENAENWSDYLRDASGAAYLTTVLLTPGGNGPVEWSANKIKGLAVGAAAWGVAAGATDLLKGQADRTRPDESDERSFPSGHASTAGAFTTLGRRNVSSLSISPSGRKYINLTFYGIAAGTAWARVEAKKHYPSDVLAGYAIGHLSSAIISDAFLGLYTENGPSLAIEPGRRRVNLHFTWRY
jgi:hypothetical protein